MILGDLARPRYPITLIDRDPAHDLALLRITEYRPPVPLRLEFDNITVLGQLVCRAPASLPAVRQIG
jgi:hypothetical protein